MGRVNRYVMNDLGGGQCVLKLAWVINFQKPTTIPLLGFFIGWYHNTSPEAWIYFGDAEHLRAGLDSQGLRLSRFEFSQAHHYWRRYRELSYGLGLVLVIRLAAHLGRRTARVPAAGLRLVQPMHQPMHFRVRDHDRRRCPEVLHSSPQTRADLPTARMMKQRICASMNLASAQ